MNTIIEHPLSDAHEMTYAWPQPMPIKPLSAPETPYPLDALPASLQRAVRAYHHYGQQPLFLIANSALANISLACQSQANVAPDPYLVSPVSLYFLTCGLSGERKSAVDNVFSRACRQWEHKIRQQRAPEIAAAKTMHDTWKLERDTLITQLKRALLNEENTHYLKSELAAHLREEPQVPLQPMLYFEDATIEALVSDLALNWPSASLWSDEAAVVLGSHSMRSNPTKFVALLNRTWDGKSLNVHRKGQAHFVLENRRLTINLMMQPLLLQKLASQSQGICRQSGFLARCLLAHPKTTMGQRFYCEPPASLDGLTEYDEKITQCLSYSEQLTRDGCWDLPTLHLSASAKSIWVHYFNQVETGLNPQQGQWHAIRDFASKAAENAARLAALFHLFESKAGDIEAESIEKALTIVHWHLNETRRLMIPFPQDTQFSDAEKLMNWLLTKQLRETTPRIIQQSSPIRQRERRDCALSVLIAHHWLRFTTRNNQTVIEVNPNVFLTQ